MIERLFMLYQASTRHVMSDHVSRICSAVIATYKTIMLVSATKARLNATQLVVAKECAPGLLYMTNSPNFRGKVQSRLSR